MRNIGRGLKTMLLASAIFPLTPALAQPVPAPPASAAPPLASPAPQPGEARPDAAPKRAAPKLIVAIAVDQFSADLFAQYRGRFTGGLARLATGVVFPSGYQSHAATETCPGHSTILTGDRPARTGIIANNWYDLAATREDKKIYCAEDERVPGSSSKSYQVSPRHLRVPTLGERMKAADPRARVVAVAGKDRAAVMMAGHAPDSIWWWGTDGFVSYADRPVPAAVAAANRTAADRIGTAQPAMPLPAACASADQQIPMGGGFAVGTGRFARAAEDADAFRRSPEADAAVIGLASGLIDELKLGRGAATDILAIGASATDYIGHAYGTEGTEMCLQLLSLDRSLGALFASLDAAGIDYLAMLTADHGSIDAPERADIHAATDAARLDPALLPETVGAAIAADMGLGKSPIVGELPGSFWIDPTLSAALRRNVREEAMRVYAASDQVAAIFTREQIEATRLPHAPPESWTLLERARASFDEQRSGDFVVALKPRVTPIPRPGPGYVATHGSFWDYDRRVPILFWRKGMTGFEQPLSVETIDIAPTLAAAIGLAIAPGEMDGRCLDLDAGPASSCR